MKFTINSSILLSAITPAVSVTTNTNMVVLENIKFELIENKMTITGTDLENTISTETEVLNSEDGAALLPAKLLTEILKTFSDKPLTFDKKENSFLIKSSSGEYNIPCEEAHLFPTIQEIEKTEKIVLEAKDLVYCLGKANNFVGNDELRPVMNGILFNLKNKKITFVATDAHRLIKCECAQNTEANDFEFIVHKKGSAALLAMLQKCSGEVEIIFNQSNARFIFDKNILTTRLIDAKYPNYEAVIPKENDKILLIGKALFLNALKSVSILSSKLNNQISLNIAGQQLTIIGEDLAYSNKGTETLVCNFEGNDLKIGFNGRYLIAALGNIDGETVKMEFTTENRAALLYPAEDEKNENIKTTILLMPAKIV